ncbi:MAG TPA: hypothetical protein VH914_08965 [Acidimicrobiia bacterium]|jgi:hypothetical protein|nr:hypothetical protein [Acidimicrobiia bacterium]
MTSTITTTDQVGARTPTRGPAVAAVCVAAVCVVLGFAARGDHHHGLTTRVYTGTITIVSADHNAIALDIASGAHGAGNGFAFAPRVHDDGLAVGQRVALYTVDVPGRGEEIVDVRPE